MILVVAGCANAERTAPLAEPAVVPRVAGRPVPDAVRAVQSAGLRPALAASAKPVPLGACDAGTVTAQDPGRGRSSSAGRRSS